MKYSVFASEMTQIYTITVNNFWSIFRTVNVHTYTCVRSPYALLGTITVQCLFLPCDKRSLISSRNKVYISKLVVLPLALHWYFALSCPDRLQSRSLTNCQTYAC